MHLTPKGKVTKAKISGATLSQNLLLSKGDHQQMKRQPREWKRILADHPSDMGFISKIYHELKCTKDLNRHFPEEIHRWSTGT